MRTAYVLWDAFTKALNEDKKIKSGPVTQRYMYDLRTGMQLGSSYMLMSGFAIENLVKGLIIVHREDVANSGRLDKKIAIHDLFKLFGRAKIMISDSDQDLVKALNEAVLWKGRYGTPRDVNQLLGSSPFSAFGISIRHPRDVMDLFQRVANECCKVLRNKQQLNQEAKNFSDWIDWLVNECPRTSLGVPRNPKAL